MAPMDPWLLAPWNLAYRASKRLNAADLSGVASGPRAGTMPGPRRTGLPLGTCGSGSASVLDDSMGGCGLGSTGTLGGSILGGVPGRSGSASVSNLNRSIN